MPSCPTGKRDYETKWRRRQRRAGEARLLKPWPEKSATEARLRRTTSVAARARACLSVQFSKISSPRGSWSKDIYYAACGSVIGSVDVSGCGATGAGFAGLVGRWVVLGS